MVTSTYTYDYANRLKTASILDFYSSYAYDGDGLLMRKTTDGFSTYFTYDVNAALPVVITDSNSLYLYGLSLIAQQQGSTTSYYHQDALGSVRNLTDGSGSVTMSYGYDPFGQATSASGTASNPFRYTGQYLDNQTGLYYLRARYYQPATGRFITPDTIVPDWNDSQALNRYPYVANNPVLYTDPSGQCPLCALWELLNPDNATSAGGDLYDENGEPCGDTGCVPLAKSDSEILPRVALDAAGAKVGEWTIGALWNAVKGPVTSGVEKLGGAIRGVFARGGTAGAADATAAVLRPPEGALAESATKAACEIRPISGGAPREIIPWDSRLATRQILGQPLTGGYAVTPGGRTISLHAAERIAYGGGGRPPTTLEFVDRVLDTGTHVMYDPIRNTIRVTARQLPGKPYVVVSASDPSHIVTVMAPK